MRLVVHADDCGLTMGITRHILDCAEAGVISGASILAGGHCPGSAAKALADSLKPAHGVPPVGVHLNLLEGRSVLPHKELPLLTRPDGIFRHSLAGLLAELYAAPRHRRLRLLREAEAEWQAQAAVVAQVLPGSALYIDGHLHVHALPALRPALFALLASFPIAYVRVPDEPRYFPPASLRLHLAGTLRRELLRSWSRGLASLLEKKGILSPGIFLGAYCSGGLTTKNLAAALSHARKYAPQDALVELMTHPGAFADGEFERQPELAYGRAYASPRRAEEKKLLLSSDFRAVLGSGR